MTNDIGYLLKTLADDLKKYADAEFKKNGLTFSQCNAVQYIEKCGGMATQKDIEEYFGVSHPTVVGIINRLEAKEMVRCRTNEKDRRVKNVYLTDYSKNICEHIRMKKSTAESRLLSNLTDEQLETLRTALCVMHENINNRE